MVAIRKTMAAWVQWYLFEQPAGTSPPAWSEGDVFNNILPWTPASTGAVASREHLHFKLHCAVQERQRCEEELVFLPEDAISTLDYYQRQREQVEAAAAAAAAAAVANAAVPTAAEALLAGRVHILRCWSNRIGTLQLRALNAFAAVGWVDTTALARQQQHESAG